MKGLKDAISEVGPEPCIGCPCFARCRDEHLSCSAFNDYANKQSRKPPRGKPTRKHYDRLFGQFREIMGAA